MKKFSQNAAANFVPLLARLLLFLAFVPIGWHHAMQHAVFTGESAIRLQELGVEPTLAANAAQAGLQDLGGGGPALQTRAMHALTLTFDGLRLPRPDIWAWSVTVIELVGGALVLIGLFSRVWTAGMVLWGLVLFGLTSWAAVRGTWFFTTPEPDLSRALSQLALIVLALGITLTGPGKLSLDGQIFRGAGGGGGGEGDEEE
ncbi:MAG: DoxX family protein [Phycisphaerales bacterium]